MSLCITQYVSHLMCVCACVYVCWGMGGGGGGGGSCSCVCARVCLCGLCVYVFMCVCVVACVCVCFSAVGDTPGLKDYNANFYSDGTVYYNFPTVFSVMCKMDVTYFPFDVQTCPLIVRIPAVSYRCRTLVLLSLPVVDPVVMKQLHPHPHPSRLEISGD